MLQSLGRLRIDNGHETVQEQVSGESLQLAAGQLGEEAEAAISRLSSLGFPRAQVSGGGWGVQGM